MFKVVETAKEDQYYFDNLIALKEHFRANKATIEPMLDMKVFRDLDSYNSTYCKTCGCVLGHAISIPRFHEFIHKDTWLGSINFPQFSLKAFNIRENSLEWDYLFGQSNTNSVDDFLERLENHIRHLNFDDIR